jgi:Dioxygenase
MLLPSRRRAPLTQGGAFLSSVAALACDDSACDDCLLTFVPKAAQEDHIGSCSDSDNDLVRVAGHAKSADGIVTHVGGRLLDRNGRSTRGARIEIWQCDAHGRYHDSR